MEVGKRSNFTFVTAEFRQTIPNIIRLFPQNVHMLHHPTKKCMQNGSDRVDVIGHVKLYPSRNTCSTSQQGASSVSRDIVQSESPLTQTF